MQWNRNGDGGGKLVRAERESPETERTGRTEAREQWMQGCSWARQPDGCAGAGGMETPPAGVKGGGGTA